MNNPTIFSTFRATWWELSWTLHSLSCTMRSSNTSTITWVPRLSSNLKLANGVKYDFDATHITYNEGPIGTKRLREAMASHLNDYFDPFVPVTSEDVTFTAGVTGLNEMIAFSLTDEGDGILLGRPIYGSFYDDLMAKSKQAPRSTSPITSKLMKIDVNLCILHLVMSTNSVSKPSASMKRLYCKPQKTVWRSEHCFFATPIIRLESVTLWTLWRHTSSFVRSTAFISSATRYMAFRLLMLRGQRKHHSQASFQLIRQAC